MRVKRVVLPGLLGVAAYFALFGGEYSYLELRAARAHARREAAELTERRRQIDSLQAWADSLDVDSATLERLARERFGMLRPGEILYRFAESDDSAAADTVGSGGR
ncbi:MAG TPA: septum formation initiator family protein [Longimicrobiales bacterium]|nr:septum formation initiator family protein [Longimicrobiales bacterium]